MPYQVSTMGWVGSGGDFCGLGWVGSRNFGLGWVGFWKSDPWPTLSQPTATELFQSPLYGSGTVFHICSVTSRLLLSSEDALLGTLLPVITVVVPAKWLSSMDTLIALTYLICRWRFVICLPMCQNEALLEVAGLSGYCRRQVFVQCTHVPASDSTNSVVNRTVWRTQVWKESPVFTAEWAELFHEQSDFKTHHFRRSYLKPNKVSAKWREKESWTCTSFLKVC